MKSLCLTHVKPSARVMTATSIGPPTVSSEEEKWRCRLVMETRFSAIFVMSSTLNDSTALTMPSIYSSCIYSSIDSECFFSMPVVSISFTFVMMVSSTPSSFNREAIFSRSSDNDRTLRSVVFAYRIHLVGVKIIPQPVVESTRNVGWKQRWEDVILAITDKDNACTIIVEP